MVNEQDQIEFEPDVQTLRKLYTLVKGGCTCECEALSYVQQYERDRRAEMERNSTIAEQERRDFLKEKLSDD